MDFLQGLLTTNRGNDYLKVHVDCFKKMIEMIPCKKIVLAKQVAQMFFDKVWVYFGLPSSIIFDNNSRLLKYFWQMLCELMDTKLKESTTFHSHVDGQT